MQAVQQLSQGLLSPSFRNAKAPPRAQAVASKEDAFPTPVRQVSYDEGEVTLIPPDTATAKSLAAVSVAKRASTPSTASFPSVEITSYWCSYEAVKIFAPRRGESPEDSLNIMVARLEEAIADKQFGHAFGRIVEGGLRYHHLSKSELQKIARKATYVCAALKESREVIGSYQAFSFGDCCKRAAVKVSPEFRSDQRVQGTTVARWYRDFRRMRAFALPAGRKYAIAMRQGIIAFFHQNPILYSAFFHYMSRYSRAGIEIGMASEIAYKHFIEKLLPQAAKDHGYREVHFYLAHNFQLTQIQRSVFEAWYREISAHHAL